MTKRLAATSLMALAAFFRAATADAAPTWIASWGAAQMAPAGGDALPVAASGGVTARETVRLSTGGDALRLRISNAFGAAPLVVGAVHVARPLAPGRAAIDPASDRAVTFAGHEGATIPPGAELYSDPVAVPLAARADVTVSLFLSGAAAGRTGHPGARATGFAVDGDAVAKPDLPGARTNTHWYHLADIEVAKPSRGAATLVVAGDSITDGHGATTDGNDRWTDRLAERMAASPATAAIGVVNAGIGGNHVLTDGIGPNLLARFDRDVIARAGVRVAILFEGINDIGLVARERPDDVAAHRALVRDVTDAYRQMVTRAHAHGIRLIGATITPFVGSDYYHPGAASEADRQAINAFIRASGIFDGVIDFDAATRDPAHPERLLPRFDSGDHLHPSPAGYRAMGDAVPLMLVAP